jgi:hypothetical protein
MKSRKNIYLFGFFIAFIFFFACESELPEISSNIGQASLSASSAANQNSSNQAVDSPDGFQVKVLARHAPFPDDLAAQFRLKFADGKGKTHVKNFDDLSTMIVAEAIFQESGSTTGWHIHPGVALVNMVEGTLEVVWENDCTPHLYSAGDGWLDMGEVHTATAVSDGARAYVTFLGIPNGQPATIWVSPRSCE